MALRDEQELREEIADLIMDAHRFNSGDDPHMRADKCPDCAIWFRAQDIARGYAKPEPEQWLWDAAYEGVAE